MQVEVEVIATRIVRDDIDYVVTSAACPRSTDPEAAARATLASLFPSLWLRRTVVRPMTWRYEGGRVVLTYVAYSDEFDVSRLPLRMSLAALARAERAPMARIAMAVRQLARLARDEPVCLAEAMTPVTLAALRRLRGTRPADRVA